VIAESRESLAIGGPRAPAIRLEKDTGPDPSWTGTRVRDASLR
jgi:hypothetical protein